MATANPTPLSFFLAEPITTPPTIVVYSPVQNESYDSPNVLLNFSVIKPDAWFPVGEANSTGAVFGNVTSVYYAVDGGERQNITVHDVNSLLFNSFVPQTLSFSTTLNLTAGAHNVQISVEADSYYVENILSYQVNSVVVFGSSEPVSFTVALPEPVIVVPQNITYHENRVPLAFTVGASATSWVGYSLDGKDNVTIAGNTTLTGLSYGEHNITVYANDTFGNVGSSQTITFIIAKPEAKSFPTATAAAVSGVSAVIVIAGLMVYFKKHKH
ncbi:MAG: hypothetical protein ABSA75_10905 [Candidatus Bathyarchaeia archaeon]